MLTIKDKITDQTLNGLSLVLLFIINIFSNLSLNRDTVSIIFIILIYPIGSLFFIYQNKNSFGNSFSNHKLFAIGYMIVFFQVPLDYMIGNDLNFQFLFYDINKAGKSFSFSALCFVLYVLGAKSYSLNFGIHISKPPIIRPSSPSLFLIISLVFLAVFFISAPKGYFSVGGYSNIGFSETAFSSMGYYIRFSTLVIIQIVINNKVNSEALRRLPLLSGIIRYLRLYNVVFLLSILIFIILIFMSGDRGPAFKILFPFIFGYLVLRKKKMSLLVLLGFIFGGGILMSVFKFTSGLDFSNLSASFEHAFLRFSESERNNSIIPSTSELASSIYSYNVLFKLYNDGVIVYGMSMLTHLLMFIPGGVYLFYELTGLSVLDTNTAIIGTQYSMQNYGIGTAFLGDLLLNFGSYITMVIVYYIGKIFNSFDNKIYNSNSPIVIIVSFMLISNSISGSRYSVFEPLGSILFCYIMYKINSKLARKVERINK